MATDISTALQTIYDGYSKVTLDTDAQKLKFALFVANSENQKLRQQNADLKQQMVMYKCNVLTAIRNIPGVEI